MKKRTRQKLELQDLADKYVAERLAHIRVSTQLAGAYAERDYWFGVTDMRERLLAEQRDRVATLEKECRQGNANAWSLGYETGINRPQGGHAVNPYVA